MKRKRYAPTYLRAHREARGMTQAELAEYMGYSVQAISAIERGERPYTQAFLEAAALHLSRSPADLLSVDPNAASPAQIAADLVSRLPPDRAADALRILHAVSAPPAPPLLDDAAPPKARRRRPLD